MLELTDANIKDVLEFLYQKPFFPMGRLVGDVVCTYDADVTVQYAAAFIDMITIYTADHVDDLWCPPLTQRWFDKSTIRDESPFLPRNLDRVFNMYVLMS